MFWGLIMEPQKMYSQTVKTAFHISMAAIDLDSSTDDVVQVKFVYDSRKYVLCSLQRDKTVQCSLDLNFDVGTQVSFINNGSSDVHLTGYLVQDKEDLLGDLEVGQLNGMPAKLNNKMEKLVKSCPPAKNLKTMDLLQDNHDDDDGEDSDVDLNALLSEEEEDEDVIVLDEEDSSDDEEDAGEDEIAIATDSGSDTEEDDGDEDDDDEEEEDDDSIEEEENPVVATVKQNGTVKKAKKEVKPDQMSSKSEKKQQKKTIEGGVVIEDIRAGNGELAKEPAVPVDAERSTIYPPGVTWPQYKMRSRKPPRGPYEFEITTPIAKRTRFALRQVPSSPPG